MVRTALSVSSAAHSVRASTERMENSSSWLSAKRSISRIGVQRGPANSVVLAVPEPTGGPEQPM